MWNQRSEKEIDRINRIFQEIGFEAPEKTLQFASLRKEARTMHEAETGSRPEKNFHNKRCPTSGKICFPSPATAQDVLLHRKRNGSGTGFLRVYQCPDCHEYHLTSGKPRKK